MADDSNEAAEPLDGAAYLGVEVRAWRLERGLSQRKLAEEAQYSQQYVAKVEAGERLASPEFVEVCDRVFGTPGTFARLRKRAAERGYPDWFEPYLGLERRATEVLSYSNSLIMGLLQTEEYAREVFRKARPQDDEETRTGRVVRRVRRRRVLESENPPLLWAIVDEACLRREVGSAAVMRAQMAHLLASGALPHVTLQVFPFRSGAPSSNSAFIVLRFGDDEPDVLYSESRVSGQVSDSVGTVAKANTLYDLLRADALSPDDSLALIHKIMEEWTS
ncbi:helix-turn-helix transcriptional regulator [Streptomyces sp. AV19]|uniref:helix-turn-helix domain-containing protein n=1 Tax=Streptomyces sp. AV19 TaxID=2793068 RepID=UPI0018FEAD1A|nr:helix-turn-helix transcriptional regulator [Streptomyces sp. AV19]MBH1937064.1 helix-turn-helix transcriptional regulator [Streptomyces sp. AV19]MDG4535903.1 helix-turn-helix transcriptional regulator [Streptomyces sp. AV19]